MHKDVMVPFLLEMIKPIDAIGKDHQKETLEKKLSSWGIKPRKKNPNIVLQFIQELAKNPEKTRPVLDCFLQKCATTLHLSTDEVLIESCVRALQVLLGDADIEGDFSFLWPGFIKQLRSPSNKIRSGVLELFEWGITKKAYLGDYDGIGDSRLYHRVAIYSFPPD
jgi:hypothetical protein